MNELFCPKLGECGGCSWGTRDVEAQRVSKLEEIETLLALLERPTEFAKLPHLGLRDRVDLVWENGLLGLYGMNSRQVVNLEQCPMMSTALEEFFKTFRLKAPPIRKGSVRLRVSPSGEKGVWLDFANVDVKTLFEERDYLHWLSSLAVVEIGQRRKVLTWKDGQPKLVDPVLRPWFETYDGQGQAIPLWGPIGGFSQSGFKANRALIETVVEAVALSGVNDWLELFSGNGNFALSLASRGYQVEALELEGLAVEGLQKSLKDHPEWPVVIQKSDVYLKSKALPEIKGRGLLVDPPRAGLRQVLDWLENGPKPSSLVYVSCFAQVLKQDVERLKLMGYKLTWLKGVDQFVHSPHTEWVALLNRAEGS